MYIERVKELTQQNPQVVSINKELFRYSGRNMSAGGSVEKSPLQEFYGTVIAWDVEPSTFDATDTMVYVDFDKVQPIRVRDGEGPYVLPTARLTFKYSDRDRSNFGIFVGSMNKALNVEKAQSDLDLLIGKVLHMKAQPYNWGKIKNSTVADENGDTWGEIWEVNIPPASASPPAAVAAPAQPPTQPPVAVQAVPVAGSDPGEATALALLHGKDKSAWLQLALTNEIIKADANLFTTIISDVWLAGQIAAGKVTENPDKTHTVN